MAFDPTTLSPSIVIDGADVREHFELEVVGIKGNRSLRLLHRENDKPLDHGTDFQGGTYEPPTLRLSGWMPVTKRAALLRHLHHETRIPGLSQEDGTIILKTDAAVVYHFDSVSRVEFAPQSNQWRIDPDVNVVIEFTISHVFPIGIEPHTKGLQLQTVKTFEGAAAAPDFDIMSEAGELFGVGFREELVTLLGPSTNPKISSAEMSAVFDFDSADLKGVNVEGDAVTAEVWGYQDSTLIADGDMEKSGVADWVMNTGTATKEPAMGTFRVMGGTQCLKVAMDAGVGNRVRPAVAMTLTSGDEVHVHFWLFPPTSGDIPKVVLDGPVTANLINTTLANLGAVAGKIKLIEFTFKATDGTGTYTMFLEGLSGDDVFYIDDYVAAKSLLKNGTFTDWTAGQPDNWTNIGSPTVLEETSDRWPSSLGSALDIDFNATSDHIRHDSVASVAGAVYHVTGRIKEIDSPQSGKVRIDDNVGSEKTLNVVFRPDVTTYRRFSFHYHSRGTASFQLKFHADDTNVQIRLDSVAVCKLGQKTGADLYHFETSPYGRALQLGIGECVKISDYVSGKNHTIVGQLVPRFGELNENLGCGTTQIFMVGYDEASLVNMIYGEQIDGLAYYQGNQNRINEVGSPGIEPLRGSTKRGVLGFAARFSSPGDWLPSTDDGKTIFMEKPDAVAGNSLPFEQAEANSTTSISAMANTPDTILLSDAGAWAGFWCYNYPLETPKILGLLTAPKIPKSHNRSLLWTGTLAEGDALMIDVERYKVEHWDADHATQKLNDAFAGVTGDLPRWRDCPVVFTKVNIPIIRAKMKIEGR